MTAFSEVSTEAKNFGDLNYDCLIHIFSFLSIVDRVNAQTVCKQWHSASQESWRSFKQLDVDRAKWQSGNLKEFERIEMTMFKTVLEGCGRYLTEINFTHLCTDNEYDNRLLDYWDLSLNFPVPKNRSITGFEGMKALTSNCTRIEKLSLCSLVIKCDDQHLLDLFRINKNIQFLNLIGYKITGACFSELSAEGITSLLIQQCYGVLPENYCKRCTNLHTLSLNDLRIKKHTDSDSGHNDSVYSDILRFVSRLDIKSLKEFYLGSMGDVRIEQYMLKSFELNDTFKNLIAIRINDVISELMGDLLIALGENCKNLKRAEFSGCTSVTDDILINITTLPKLEVLCIDDLELITDRSITHLSEHLKVLKCMTSEISDTGVVYLLNKSQNIEILELSFCRNITNRSVNHAIEVTKHRTNSVILNMYVENTYIEQWKIKEETPFFRLRNAPTKLELKHLRLRGTSDDSMSRTRLCLKNFRQKELFFTIDSYVLKRCYRQYCCEGQFN